MHAPLVSQRILGGRGCVASLSRSFEGIAGERAIDIYDHIDLKELKEAYFGVHTN